MHIPSVTTDRLELLTFREALQAANTPNPEYDIEKWLYAPNFYSEYRYILGTRGKNPLICIGINPSTAKPGDLDNTLKSVERMPSGPPTRTRWKGCATCSCIRKILQPSGMSFPFRKNRQCGQPGAQLLKSGIIYPSA